MTFPSKQKTILAGAAALAIIAFAQLEVGPNFLKRLGFGIDFKRQRSPVFLFTNPALKLTPEEAALELVPGRFTLGDLARLLQDPNASADARTFYDGFMEVPGLRSPWDRFRHSKDAFALQQALLFAPEFNQLYSRIAQSDDFQYRMARRQREKPARAPAGFAPSSAGSLGMIRGGKELAKEPLSAARPGIPSPPSHSGPDYSQSRGSAEPQPGLSAIALGEMGVATSPQGLATVAPGIIPVGAGPAPPEPSMASVGGILSAPPARAEPKPPASGGSNNQSNDDDDHHHHGHHDGHHD